MKLLILAFVASIQAFFLSAFALAAAPPQTPTNVSGFEIISADQAKGLLGKAQFFDMRSAVNYGRGHLKGARALPYDEKSDKVEGFDAAKDKFDIAKLPADKKMPIVFYSDGPTGWKSYKAAVTASKMGYTHVRWMREGTAGWVAKGLPLE